MSSRRRLALAGGAFVVALAALTLTFVSNGATYEMLSEHILYGPYGLVRVSFSLMVVAFGIQTVAGYTALARVASGGRAERTVGYLLTVVGIVGGGVAALVVLRAVLFAAMLWAFSGLPLGGN